MSSIAKPFVVLSLVAFLIAVVAAWMGAIAGIGAEAYSRACTNLALMAIAIVLVFKDEGSAG